MLTQPERAAVITELVNIVLDQRAVRNGQVEGMVMPIEHRLHAVYELGLIHMNDLDNLLGILKIKEQPSVKFSPKFGLYFVEVLEELNQMEWASPHRDVCQRPELIQLIANYFNSGKSANNAAQDVNSLYESE